MNSGIDFIASLPGTMYDCIVDGMMFNKGKFPLGHIFVAKGDEIFIVASTIGGIPYPDMKLETPPRATHLTFDGMVGYFIDNRAEVVTTFDLATV